MTYAGEPGGPHGNGPSTSGPLILAFALLLLVMLEVFGLLPGPG
jgi:hypothetical protein